MYQEKYPKEVNKLEPRLLIGTLGLIGLLFVSISSISEVTKPSNRFSHAGEELGKCTGSYTTSADDSYCNQFNNNQRNCTYWGVCNFENNKCIANNIKKEINCSRITVKLNCKGGCEWLEDKGGISNTNQDIFSCDSVNSMTFNSKANSLVINNLKKERCNSLKASLGCQWVVIGLPDENNGECKQMMSNDSNNSLSNYDTSAWYNDLWSKTIPNSTIKPPVTVNTTIKPQNTNCSSLADIECKSNPNCQLFDDGKGNKGCTQRINGIDPLLPGQYPIYNSKNNSFTNNCLNKDKIKCSKYVNECEWKNDNCTQISQDVNGNPINW